MRAQARPLQQRLMDGDRLADLALFAVQIAENHVHFERVGVEARGPAQLLDREIDLVGDEKVEAEDVVRRLARAPAIDPRAAAQLVALPRLADREARRAARSARPAAARTRSFAAGRGNAGFVEVRGDHAVPQVLRLQDQLDQLARGAVCRRPSG